MPPRLGPSGPSDIVPIRMSEEQKREMQQAAARAKLSLSEFIRQSGLFCASPEMLDEMLSRHREKRESDPQMRQYLDERRKKDIRPRRQHK